MGSFQSTAASNSAAAIPKSTQNITTDDLNSFHAMLQLLEEQKKQSEDGRHSGVTCGICQSENFTNYRYTCLICKEFDICSKCFDNQRVCQNHQINHPVVRFDEPNELFGEEITGGEISLASLKKKYASEKHENVVCDSCGMVNIVGLKFKCNSCKNFDLCSECYDNQVETESHKKEHAFIVEGKPKNLFINPDNFDLLDKIGQGSYGAVFKAKLKPIDQTVAVKIINADTTNKNSQVLVKSFVREVEAYSEIKATNILRMYGYSMFKIENTPCMALITEFMSKGSLASVLAKEPELPSEKRLDMAYDISCGMVKIHERGFIHRDIRPDNILVDENYQVKIGDMGITREFNQAAMTQVGCVPYMPFEFFVGKYDQKLDIFTFGLTLNEIFGGTTHINPPVVIGEKIKTKAPVFGRLISQCTKMDPKERPNARKIQNLLEKYVGILRWLLEDFKSQIREQTFEKQTEMFNELCSKIDEHLF